MRANRETLLRISRELVDERVEADRNLLSVYLCGSLLGEDFLIGGTTDVDLVFIHVDTVKNEREILPLMEDVHLDIAHHAQNVYRTPRSLRVHPWLGPTIKDCEIWFDPQHFMSFTQASVRGQYERPDRVYERARGQIEQSRKFWRSYQFTKTEAGPDEVLEYLKALEQAVNAVASFNGPPLTERRFLLDFPQRAGAIGKPGMLAGLLGLLGAPNIDIELIPDLINPWNSAYHAVSEAARPARLNPVRMNYYLKAFEFLIEKEQAQAILWPLMKTWTLAIQALPEDSPEFEPWQQVFRALGLISSGFDDRIAGLDAFLDLIEETTEAWARNNGVWIE